MSGKHDLLWHLPNQGPQEQQYADGKTFQIHGMTGEQHISHLAKYELRVTAKQEDLISDDFLGKVASFELLVGDELKLKKTFSGVITDFTKSDTCFGNTTCKEGVDCHYNYHLTIQPKLWFLTQRFNSRVFSYTNEEDLFKVIETVLKEHDVKFSRKRIDKKEEKSPEKGKKKEPEGQNRENDPKAGNSGKKVRAYHETRYVVQYRETDYAFISRLLEQEGVWFYFDHEDDTLVFCDDMGDIPWMGPHRTLSYCEDKSAYHKEGFEETLFDFHYTRAVGPNRFIINDYNYETADTDWQRHAYGNCSKHTPELTHYEHTRAYANKPKGGQKAMDATGTMLCETMMQEAMAASHMGRAVSTSRSLQAGHKFTLQDHWIKRFNGGWVVTSLVMSVHQRDYTVTVKALPMSEKFRPARKTPAAAIHGQQTATVTGPAGSDIYTDDLGRCKIHFHWDLDNKKDDKASMWVRVANGYAGKDYGIQWIPRVGHEVLVSFIDGNPSHPVINGRVYNQTNTPPIPAARKTQNIIKTIKDNHILFDDKDGAELLNLRAQKDMNALVLNNYTLTVGADATESIGGDRTVVVQKDQRIRVHGNGSLWINDDYNIEVEKGDRCATVKAGDDYTEVECGDKITTVGGTSIDTFKNGWEASVSGSDRFLDVYKDDIKWVGKDTYLKVDGANYTDIMGDYMINSSLFQVIADKEIRLEAPKIHICGIEELKLSSGSNQITLTPEEIKIEGIKVLSTSVGRNIVAGGLVMIN
ncbi:type VI secretion system Vgr family protein [Acanthopleuribacter pedis]|uniref:Type VI secretion system tip protein VgrG n=1 Tax=Acanthopleuribacter pedis TaxID=442870 RepID=A0A8J7QAQ4_9BACT|nr:type VI secretion system tip protein TssI/VgrG [Acanthopleuribacter pedis]MBO1320730.1 type VI secretion system tip protein VgrG [Acanthopleuribacter pedis]